MKTNYFKLMSRKSTKEEFIINSKKIHGALYDYSNVDYKGNKEKVEIICKEHGSFFQKPNNHISLKHGCPKCKANKNARRLTKSFNEFYIQAKLKFDDRFEYHEADFNGFSIVTRITCKKHGDFNQTPYRHITSANGCKECSIEKNTHLPVELREFVRKARGVVQQSYLRKNFSKKSRTSELLKCDWDTFKRHLENNPYGFKITDKNLDLDHIIPTSSANSEDDIIRLNYYTNFQLLPSVYNRNIKKNKPFDRDGFEKWLSINKTELF